MNIFDQCLLKLSTVRNIESPSDCLMMLGPLNSVCVPVVILNEVEGAAGCKESTCSCLWCLKMAAPAGLLSVMNGTRWIRTTKDCFLPWRPLCVLLVVISVLKGRGMKGGEGGVVGWVGMHIYGQVWHMQHYYCITRCWTLFSIKVCLSVATFYRKSSQCST